MFDVKNLKIRWKLLIIILPIIIIPFIVIIILTSIIISNNLINQNNEYYSTILNQILNNMNFSYKQYALTLSDISQMENFNKIINHPKFIKKEDRRDFFISIGEWGPTAKSGSVYNNLITKIEGNIWYINLDYAEYIEGKVVNEELITFPFVSGGYLLYINQFLNSRTFKELKRDNSFKLFIGKIDEETISDFDAEKKSMMIFPIYKNNNKGFNQALVIVLPTAYISDFYSDITNIKYGTLYFLDKFDNIMHRSHPNDNDYYEFDFEKNRYILGDDNPNDKYEKMSFKDYQKLNVDSEILKDKEVIEVLDSINNEDFSQNNKIRIIDYKNNKYLFCSGYSTVTNVKLLFFLPISRIYNLIFKVMSILALISFIIIVMVIIASFIFSKIFTKPITSLYNGAIDISSGKYNIDLDIDHFSGEFRHLGKTFINMADKIRDYNEQSKKIIDNLKESDSLKSDFISNISHELRTPLTSIQGFAKIINKKFNENIIPIVNIEDKNNLKNTTQIRENIGIILTESDKLTKIINNLIELTVLESDKTEWNDKYNDLSKIIENITEKYRPDFNKKNINLIDELENNVICNIDEMRITRVIENLLINAMNFTEKGEVKCLLKKEKSEIVIKISDTGLGITKENHTVIFEKFKQIGDIMTDKPHGTGLGLYICKLIVEHYKGKIRVESGIGKGSVFSISLPVSANIG